MAGGIPFEVAERVWSYTYSTADTRSDVWEHQGTPLAGAMGGIACFNSLKHHLKAPFEAIHGH